jgi:hypothetical protein
MDSGGQRAGGKNSKGNFTALPWECQGKARRNFERCAFLDADEKNGAHR